MFFSPLRCNCYLFLLTCYLCFVIIIRDAASIKRGCNVIFSIVISTLLLGPVVMRNFFFVFYLVCILPSTIASPLSASPLVVAYNKVLLTLASRGNIYTL